MNSDNGNHVNGNMCQWQHAYA